MSPDSARKTLACYVGALATYRGSHVYLFPGNPPAVRVQDDTLVLPGTRLTWQYIVALARGCMPTRREREFDEEGSTFFIVRAVELRRRFLINVRRGERGVEMVITDADERPTGEPVPFDPVRKPPLLSVEVEPE